MADNIAWVRKYRPSSFDDYMGEDVKRLVVNRFSNRDAIPNTIMLFGTRGTGKTSMARLLCKEIHCMSPVDGHSCGECEMCMAIDEYISATEAGAVCPGITEVDAATTTGKDSINEIIEEVLIPPMWPLTKKVVIMDECHMLSVSAQNSLLKVVEEPPEHLIFILCTTDPEKVIGTIHSRMQLKLEVKKKTVDEMVQKLMWIAEQENLKVSPQALQIIAKKGDRIPRECINLLESVAMNFGREVEIETVRKALGDVSYEIFVQYFKAANTSLESILAFNKLLKDKDMAAKEFIQGLTRFVLDALYVRHGIYMDDFPKEFLVQVKELFKNYRTSDFDLLLQIVEDAYRRIDSDDTKSELIITVTALNIGKTKLLARGLSGQSDVAREENKSSVGRYMQHIEEANIEAIEKVRETEMKRENIALRFGALTEVKDGAETLGTSIDYHGTDTGVTEDPKLKKIKDLFHGL